MISSPPLPLISLSPAASSEVAEVAAATPALMLAVELVPEAEISVIVKKAFVLVAAPAFAPVTSSV